MTEKTTMPDELGAASCSALVGQHGRFPTWDGEICVCIVLAESVDLPWDSDMLHVRYVKPNGAEQYGYIPRDRFEPNSEVFDNRKGEFTLLTLPFTITPDIQ